MYTYCLILRWDSFKHWYWYLIHILYILFLFFLCVNLKKKKKSLKEKKKEKDGLEKTPYLDTFRAVDHARFLKTTIMVSFWKMKIFWKSIWFYAGVYKHSLIIHQFIEKCHFCSLFSYVKFYYLALLKFQYIQHHSKMDLKLSILQLLLAKSTSPPSSTNLIPSSLYCCFFWAR